MSARKASGTTSGASAGHGRIRARQRHQPPSPAGRLIIWLAHKIPAHRSVGLAALDVRAERPPADAAMVLGITDPWRQVIVRRQPAGRLGQYPAQFHVSGLSRTSGLTAP